jgi:serine protease
MDQRLERSSPGRGAAILCALCLAGLAEGCGGGGGGTTTYTVTASAGAGGTISPQSVNVAQRATATFAVTPDAGFLVAAVTGCGGSLQGTTYVTAPVTGACQVNASFRRPRVSGTVFPAGGTAVDSDVNDPFAPHFANDDFPIAQAIPNPVTLGGYVNAPGEGPDGRSQAEGDEFDVYRVALLANQTITLRIASEDVADDLDLHLADIQGELVDSSADLSARVESLVVPADGEYFVIVNAWTGASNYLLSIGQPVAEASRPLRLSDPFLAGELVLRLAQAPERLEDNGAPGLAALARAKGRGDGAGRRNMLVRLEELTPFQPGIAPMARGRTADREITGLPGGLQVSDRLLARKLETVLYAKALARDPAVAEVMPNYVYHLHATFTPNDPRFGLQWHYPQISLPQAWPQSTGSGVIVAVIDSGVFLGHPDLGGRLVPGWDFILGIPEGDDPGDDPVPPGGSSFHGTHVAGTVAAATDNGLGVAGVAFGARVMPLRVCTTTGCPAYAVEQGLRFAAGLPNDSGTVPAQAAGVINLSLGRSGPALASEQALFDELRALDVVVVASAGNSGSSTPGYPAAYRNVLAVSAVDIRGQLAFYSNFGPWVDVAAPGGDHRWDLNADGFPDGVLSTIADDREGPPQPRYAFLQGTSMAAPHVAGVVALMRAAAPGLAAQDIETLLRNGVITDDLGAPGRDDLYGHGLINAAKAVAEAMDSGGQPVELEPFAVASPPSVNFSTSAQSLEVVLSNTGGGELEFGTPAEDSSGWLSLSAALSDGSLVLTLSVQRMGLEEGVYSATVTVPSSANTVHIPVLMQVAQVLSANVGLQWVLLVDPETFETRHSATAEPTGDGPQAFRIDDVAPGSYLLVSGSDADNDGFVCDAGESCGVHRGPGDVVLVEVDGGDVAGLEFTSGYELATTETQAAGPLPAGIARQPTDPPRDLKNVPAGE